MMSKFCTNCDNELENDFEFCVNCGKEVNSNSNDVNNTNLVDKESKIAVGLLGIFLGTLGVHNFYLGYTNKAVVQLLITVLSCGVYQ